MSAENAFSTLKNYLETKAAIRQALCLLREDVEVGISVGGMMECALFQNEGRPHLEQRPPKNPDLIFTLRPETVYVLANQTSDDLGETLITMIKEVLAGNISIRMPGNFLDLMRNGYMDVIRAGGKRVSDFIETQGTPVVSKIMSLINNLKR